MNVRYDFRDKVVFVTGGTSGIGRATARAFEEAGATVIVALAKSHWPGRRSRG